MGLFQKEPSVKIERVVIYTDGASKGNPGPGAIGAVIQDRKGRLVTCISQAIGIATNNQAEYKALIAALEKSIRLGIKQAEIRSDSEWLVKQINGQYRVKATLIIPLHQRATELLGQLESFTITHIPREENAAADKLANAALK